MNNDETFFFCQIIMFRYRVNKNLKLIEFFSILDLIQERFTDNLKEKWWDNNPEKITCPEEIDVTDGMSIHSMSGVFVLLFSGIFIACLILGFDYMYLKNNVIKPGKTVKTRVQVLKISSKEPHKSI